VSNRVSKPAKLNILRATLLSQLPWLIHGFSTRVGGFSRVYGKDTLNLGFTKEDSKAAVERNRAAFLAELGANSGSGLWSADSRASMGKTPSTWDSPKKIPKPRSNVTALRF